MAYGRLIQLRCRDISNVVNKRLKTQIRQPLIQQILLVVSAEMKRKNGLAILHVDYGFYLFYLNFAAKLHFFAHIRKFFLKKFVYFDFSS